MQRYEGERTSECYIVKQRNYCLASWPIFPVDLLFPSAVKMFFPDLLSTRPILISKLLFQIFFGNSFDVNGKCTMPCS